MKALCTTFIFLFFTSIVFAQAPLVKQWDKRFGGTFDEQLYSFQQTADGGYILGGVTFSDISGDKTEPAWGSSDYWIVKVDSAGNKQWDKRFGGTRIDNLFSLQQTKDGGYILGGGSNSNISGNKTQNSWGPLSDYWIVKINSTGIKEWDKTFGGTSIERLFSVQQTVDGGYILGGESSSGISGDKTQLSWGRLDYWIVKLDSNGVKEWDRRFGGMEDDSFRALEQTEDKGYILGGYSYSDSSGDKSQNNWSAYPDYWIVKVDSSGNKQWDKRFGGTGIDELFSLKQTFDRGYVLGGYSASGINGDKTQLNWDTSSDNYYQGDFWIIKIDSVGNKNWDKVFGGTGKEEFGKIFQTGDHGYLLVGDSYSAASGDKSENNFGLEQTWICKVDSIGNKQWDKTMFTTGHDEGSNAILAKDECYIIANISHGEIGGYKTYAAWDSSNDYWIIKFCDTTDCNNIVSVSVNGSILTAYNAVAYQWYLNGNPINNATSNTYIATQGGSYTVAVTDTKGCVAVSSPVVITGLDNVSAEDVVSVFPNPSSDGGWQLAVGDNLIGGVVEVFDNNGRVVFKSEIRNSKSEITAGVAKGVYLLRISSSKNSVTRKLVKL